MDKIDTLYQIVWMSRPLMQAAEAAVDAGLAGTGLTVRMRAVLEILHRDGAQTVPDIATKLAIQRQYVQLMVNETLSAGLTVTRPNPRHKRSSLLELTDPGRALIETVMAGERAVLAEIADAIEATEAQAALRLIQRLTAHLTTVNKGGA